MSPPLSSRSLLALFLLLGPLSSVAQQKSTPLPPNYKTILENATFKIIRVYYGPFEKVPLHDHPDTPTVYVYLNNSGPVRITHEEKDGAQSSLVRPPTKTGAFRVSPGQLERHSIENLSDLPSDFLRVELLNLRLGDHAPSNSAAPPPQTSPTISPPPNSPSPRLSIVRAICVDKTPCPTPASPSALVVIALSGTIVTVNGQKTTLALGDALAIPHDQSFQISSAGSDPAHILRSQFIPKNKFEKRGKSLAPKKGAPDNHVFALNHHKLTTKNHPKALWKTPNPQQKHPFHHAEKNC